MKQDVSSLLRMEWMVLLHPSVTILLDFAFLLGKPFCLVPWINLFLISTLSFLVYIGWHMSSLSFVTYFTKRNQVGEIAHFVGR
jgi:uncharacterized membrane protein